MYTLRSYINYMYTLRNYINYMFTLWSYTSRHKHIDTHLKHVKIWHAHKNWPTPEPNWTWCITEIYCSLKGIDVTSLGSWYVSTTVYITEWLWHCQRWGSLVSDEWWLTHVLDINQILHHVQQDHAVVRLVQVVHVTWKDQLTWLCTLYNEINDGR